MNELDLSKNYKTPMYIFSVDELTRRIGYLRTKVDSQVTLCYAIKANTFLLPYLKDKIEKFEVCSEGEYRICELNGLDDAKIVISGVYKTFEFIDELVCNHEIGLYTIESYTQYDMLKDLAIKYNKRINVLIRRTSLNQFGVSDEDLYKIIDDNCKLNCLNIKGLEYFSGTQKNKLKIHERELNELYNLIMAIKEKYGLLLELEYGTGFPVNYFVSTKFDEEFYLEQFNLLLVNYSDIKITLEIGRSFVASCGEYVTKIVDIKENAAGNFLIVDGGMHHFTYYGQTMAMRIPEFSVLPKRTGNRKKYNICGSLCTVNDIIVKNVELEEVQIGDILVFKNTGAYAVTEGISLFLSRDLPAILAICDGKETLLRGHMPTYKFNTGKEEI